LRQLTLPVSRRSLWRGCWRRQGVTSVIVGSTKLSQLDDNLKAAAVTLSSAQIAELDAATALAPVYPNFFTDNIAVDRPLAEALGNR
jgi:predicted aldo/keto reductase-like oxidoreductase